MKDISNAGKDSKNISLEKITSKQIRNSIKILVLNLLIILGLLLNKTINVNMYSKFRAKQLRAMHASFLLNSHLHDSPRIWIAIQQSSTNASFGHEGKKFFWWYRKSFITLGIFSTEVLAWIKVYSWSYSLQITFVDWRQRRHRPFLHFCFQLVFNLCSALSLFGLWVDNLDWLAKKCKIFSKLFPDWWAYQDLVHLRHRLFHFSGFA